MDQQSEISTKKPYQKRPYFWYSLSLMVIIFLIISGRLFSIFPERLRVLIPVKNIYTVHYSVGILFLLVPVLLFFFFKWRDKYTNVDSLVSVNPHGAVGRMLIPFFIGIGIWALVPFLYILMIIVGCSTSGGC